MDEASLAIRPLADADRAAVKALWAACRLTVPYNDPDTDIDLARGKPGSDVLLGVLPDGRIAASVMVGHDGHRGWLYYVAVDPACRGRGFGRAMVRAAEAWLRDRQVRKAMLMVRPTNAAVRAFYAKVGWEEAPRLVLERWLVP
ncbi:GNAT family acetyltransferase [Methylobacterium organophilum]|uniref:GNAT family acetyltransferase n=1 Tax=Methylobacterium organophilum TaxID=410 RepID=UPI001F129626|nr:GNAT family acetyltransferase [Methylobacterium organophilum]UMY18742.1 GNAT family acetyltransferase [Methylobacterium organophilum]